MFGPSIISTITTLTLTFNSALAPGPDNPGAGAGASEAPAPALVAGSYEEALETLNEADNKVNMDAEAAPELLAALAGMHDFGPQLAADPDNWQIRLYARLNLARAYLELKESEMAGAAMDEAIREAMSSEVPARDFGGKVERLYKDRLGLMDAEPQGSLDVSCDVACKVYVNETEVAGGPTELYPGAYRVWVEAVEDERKLRELVVLTAAGARQLVFEKEVVLPPPPPPAPPKKLKLILPLGAQLGLMFGGAALAALGAGMAAGGATARTTTTINGGTATAPMEEVTANAPMPGVIAAGVAFAVLGTGLMTTGIVTLSLDEKRRAGERVDRTAMLNYTMQF